MNPSRKSVAESTMTGIIFTPKFLHYLKCANKFGEIFVGHPYFWNEKERKTQLVGKWRLAIWRFNMALAYTYVFFVYFRCVQVNLDIDRRNSEKIYMRVMAVYMTLSLVLHTAVIKNLELLPAFGNQYIGFSMDFEKKYSKGNLKTPNMIMIMGLVVQAIYNSINCITVLMSVNAFLRPHSPEQIPSLFKETPTLLVRILSACFIGYIEYIYHASSFIAIMIFYPSLVIFMTMINELSSVHSRITTEKLRETGNKFHMYQCIQIQVLLLNMIFNMIIIPGLKLLGILMVIYGTYAGIRMKGIQAFALGFLATFMVTLLMCTFIFLAEFHFRSTRVLREWRQQHQLDRDLTSKWAKRFVKVLPPIVAKMRTSYYVDKTMVLTLASIMAANSANFLLVNN